MTDAELLAGLCEKAQARDWKGVPVSGEVLGIVKLPEAVLYSYANSMQAAQRWIDSGLAPAILSDHDFWRAIAGEALVCPYCGSLATEGVKGCRLCDAWEPYNGGWFPRYAFCVGQCAHQTDLRGRIRYAARVAGMEEV